MNKKRILIDSRIRKEEEEYLSKYFDIIKIPLNEDVYEEISGHCDIFYTKINGKIICAPNAKIINKDFIIGSTKIENKYPYDIAYNVAQIGDNIIGSKYTDKIIKPNIIVKQGYVKCSIAVLNDNACITTDIGIYKELVKRDIDALYIEEDNIKLLNKNGNKSNMKGFIGGASFVFDNKFVLFGDLEKLSNKEKIRKFINKNNLELVDFAGLSIYDYGGVIILD